MVDLLKEYGAAILGIGFIFFLVIRIQNNANYKKKAFAALITGVVITFILITLISIDILTSDDIYRFYPDFAFTKDFFYYYAFLFTSVLMTIIIPLIFFFMGKSRHQQFKSFSYKIEKEKMEAKPTIKDEIESVYVVIRHNGNYLLRRNNDDTYSGIVRRLMGSTIFHDEMIKKVMNEFELDEDNVTYNFAGEAKLIKGKDIHYYCYTIDINEVNESLRDYYEISAYDLINYNMNEIDKQIIYHIILREKFKIEVND